MNEELNLLIQEGFTIPNITRLSNKFYPIWAIDPGDSTGVCRIHHDGSKLCTLNYQETLHFLYSFIVMPIPTTFVVERFVSGISGIAKEQPAAKITGAIELVASVTDIEVVYQTPSVIKAVDILPPARELKKLGWRWKTPHELDALRHVIYYLVTRGGRNVESRSEVSG